MKLKTKIVSLGAGILLISGVAIIAPKVVKTVSAQDNRIVATKKVTPKQEKSPKQENVAIKTALNEFTTLEEFNKKFGDFPDSCFISPDLSAEGSNDGGRTHGWQGFYSKETAHDMTATDTRNGKVEVVIKASDGAYVKDIRKALAERDAEHNK